MTEQTGGYQQVAAARDVLVDALQRWHVTDDPPYLSLRVKEALERLDVATDGAVGSVALGFVTSQHRRIRAENDRLRHEVEALRSRGRSGEDRG